MSYIDTWKRKMRLKGGNVSDEYKATSSKIIIDNFKNDPSYRKAKLRSKDSISDLDIRVVNKDINVSEKSIYVLPNTKVEVGNIISFDDKSYLVDEFESNLISPRCNVGLCNHTIVMPNGELIPCVGTDSSYGAKIFVGNEFGVERDTKLKLIIPKGNYGELLNFRIILDNDKYGIYKIGNVSVIQTNLYVLTCESDVYQEGLDRLETGVAHNENSIEEVEYEIIGSNSLSINSSEEYRIEPNINCTFEVDNEDISIVSQGQGKVVLSSTEKDILFTLSAKLDDKIVASINVITTRL